MQYAGSSMARADDYSALNKQHNYIVFVLLAPANGWESIRAGQSCMVRMK